MLPLIELIPIQLLLKECTVKLMTINGMFLGTGFFVTPQKIATCKQVLYPQGQPTLTYFKLDGFDGHFLAADNCSFQPEVDLLVIDLGREIMSKCVNLLPSQNIRRQKLWAWTFNTLYPNGAGAVPELEGKAHQNEIAILRTTQDITINSSSGTPILNMEDVRFLGVTYSMEESDQDALVIHAAYFEEYFPSVFKENQEHHQQTTYWEKSRKESQIRNYRLNRKIHYYSLLETEVDDLSIVEDTSTPDAELDALQLRKKFDPLVSPLLDTPVLSKLDISLPYYMLGGLGFEKLCHQLLVFEGKSPRFFGKSGQQDFGVDILVEEGDKRIVYQCKNLENKPSMTQIIRTIKKFEQDWLNTAGLPTPTDYIYCCPHLLNDVSDNKEFMLFRKAFKAQTGVELQFQDKAIFDANLKRVPDIVAGLFGNILAQYFCGTSPDQIERWRSINYTASAGKDAVGRFMERHHQRKIYVSDVVCDWFTDAFSRSNIMMIRGLPGHGKTIVGLELITELLNPIRRIFYRTLKETFDLLEMVDSIKRRLSLPSFFVLDDCHLHLDKLDNLLERLRPELKHSNRHFALLLIGRHVAPKENEEAVDAYDFMEELENQGLCIDFTKSNTKQVLEFLRPDLLGLSKERLRKIEEFTGGDLLLLDEMMDTIQAPNEIDDFKLDRLLERIKRRDLNRVDSPALLRLACLAQFDIAPFKAYFRSEKNDLQKWQSSLLTEIGKPRRYDLSHSSMASLYFRALAKEDVGTNETALSELTSRELMAYFQFFETQVHQAGISIDFLVKELQSVIHEQLPLFDKNNALQIRAAFFSSPSIVQLISSKLDNFPIGSLSICLQFSSLPTPEVENLYAGLLQRKFIRLLRSTPNPKDLYPMFNLALRLLRKNASDKLDALEAELPVENLLQFIIAYGSITEFFRAVQNFSHAFAQSLLSALDDGKAEKLVQKTVASGRSIGTLNLTMFELGKTEKGNELLEGLETKLGAGRFLELILSNGTLFELFKVLENSTPGFANSLLSALDDGKAEKLVQKTVASGRSIGTLNLTMFELGKTEKGNELLEGLETKLGAGRFLELILSNGTLFELFKVLEWSTPGFANSLLSALDDGKAEKLVQKAIASGRSIGTLNLTMFELGKTEKGNELLEGLETKLGAGRFLELILSNGTLFELFSVLQYSTPGFAQSLLTVLDEGRVKVLLDKGIETGRSMESWVMGLIMFKRFPNHISKIEDSIRWWGIFKQNGTLNSLCAIREAMRDAFRDAFTAASVSMHEGEWGMLIANSQLPKICQVYSEILSFYPKGTRQAFQAAFKTGVAAAVAKSDWRNLHAARLPEANMLEVLPGAREFKEALRLRTSQAQIGDLLRLPLLEAINAIAFLWRENGALREKLVTHFWEILPEPSLWDKEGHYVGSLRLLMNVACSIEFPTNEANKLIEILKKPWSGKTYKKIHTKPLFLYYWNLAALNYERGGRHSFQQVLPEATKSALFNILETRLNRKNRLEEVHSLCCLSGLLYFLYPNERSHIEQIAKANLWVDETLRQLLGDAPFILAFFGWFGVSTLERLENNYKPSINAQLFMKAEAYNEKGPAIEYLVKKIIDFNAGNWSPWNRI